VSGHPLLLHADNIVIAYPQFVQLLTTQTLKSPHQALGVSYSNIEAHRVQTELWLYQAEVHRVWTELWLYQAEVQRGNTELHRGKVESAELNFGVILPKHLTSAGSMEVCWRKIESRQVKSEFYRRNMEVRREQIRLCCSQMEISRWKIYFYRRNIEVQRVNICFHRGNIDLR
jgi:hypothetical protein